jgi:hypothetical protein
MEDFEFILKYLNQKISSIIELVVFRYEQFGGKSTFKEKLGYKKN